MVYNNLQVWREVADELYIQGLRPTTPDQNTILKSQEECERKAEDVLLAQREILEC